MADEYLWDKTGPVDPEIAALESLLAPLRGRGADPMLASSHAPRRLAFAPRPIAARTRPSWSSTIGAAVLVAAATGALIWVWVAGTRPGDAREIAAVDEPAEVASVGAPARGEAPLVAPPRVQPLPPATIDPAPALPPGPAVAPEVPIPEAEAEKDAKSEAAANEDRPQRLSMSQVRAGIAPRKRAAVACGERHGARGERVLVKLSISGATGKVTSATAVGEHAGTDVGRCVADALGRAVFPRFEKTSMGVQYPVRLGGEPSDVFSKPSEPSKPTNTEGLPEAPSQSEVKAAIEAVKDRAKACGKQHGALPGEKVVVKLSIAGETGRVTSWNATGKHRSTPLGECVAAALGEAVFPRFAKESVGVQYPVTMPGS